MKFTEERKQNISKALKGRKITEEWRKNMSLSHLGKKREPFTDEHKKRLRESNKKAWSNPELRE
jgi:hypothetical protein